MKNLISAISLAILIAGQAQAQAFNRDASAKQVAECVAHLEVGGMFTVNNEIGENARSAAVNWLSHQPDQVDATLSFLMAKSAEFSNFIIVGVLPAPEGFANIDDLRKAWASYALKSQACTFAMGMTPAEAWPELGDLLNSL